MGIRRTYEGHAKAKTQCHITQKPNVSLKAELMAVPVAGVSAAEKATTVAASPAGAEDASPCLLQTLAQVPPHGALHELEQHEALSELTDLVMQLPSKLSKP